MRYDHRQSDLFDEPAPPDPEPSVPLYTIAELDALYEQLRRFHRVPDEWCPGWNEMVSRAYVTLRASGPEDRAHLRATFLAEARRLEKIEYAEARAQEEAAAAAATHAAEEAKAAKRRRKAAA